MNRRLRIPVPSTKALVTTWIVVVTLAATAVIGLFVAVASRVGTVEQRADTSLQERRELRSLLVEYRADAEEERAKRAALTAQVEALGEKPIVPAASPRGEVRFIATPSLVATAVREQLDDALNRVCDGSCKGKSGKDGADGVSPPAPPPGVDGKDGKDGTNGKDGRGIASGPTCNDDGTWTTTFTDGTTENQPGPCRVSLIPPSPDGDE